MVMQVDPVQMQRTFLVIIMKMSPFLLVLRSLNYLLCHPKHKYIEKDNFINSVICYARLYIMKCKILDKQIAIEGFLNLIENEGVLYPI